MKSVVLAIESSCDETAAAVLLGDRVLSNVVAGQDVHARYGGVVPELASRAHQGNIVPVVSEALRLSGMTLPDIDVVACTAGPGLMGALLVGTSFAKSLALALGKTLIGVNHMQGHILAHFIRAGEDQPVPSFPFLCLTVSGGHTQLVLVKGPLAMQVIGETLDDAAGEAFDKAAKLLGLPYPGGPQVDRLADQGEDSRFKFTQPKVPGLDFSFSGLKTSLLYQVKALERLQPNARTVYLNDICASYRKAVVDYLLAVTTRAMHQTGVRTLALAGGVSANRLLRAQLQEIAGREGWKLFIPPLAYCTDNAAMIGMAAAFLHESGISHGMDLKPMARMEY